MGNGSGLSRGDRNRNARLAQLRVLVPVTNAIVGIDLADKKQMVVVADHDSKVLARRTFSCRAWDLGARRWTCAQAGRLERTAKVWSPRVGAGRRRGHVQARPRLRARRVWLRPPSGRSGSRRSPAVIVPGRGRATASAVRRVDLADSLATARIASRSQSISACSAGLQARSVGSSRPTAHGRWSGISGRSGAGRWARRRGTRSFVCSLAERGCADERSSRHRRAPDG